MDANLQKTSNLACPNTLVTTWFVQICKSSEYANQYKTVLMTTRCGSNLTNILRSASFHFFRFRKMQVNYITSCTNLTGVTTAGCRDTWQIWTWLNHLTCTFANGAWVTRVRNLRGLFKLYGSKIQMKTYIWCKLLIAPVMCICCFMWKCQDCAYLYQWLTENIWDIEIKLMEPCYHTTGNVKIVSHQLSQDGLVYRQMVGEFYATMILQIVIICDMNVCVNYW